MALFQISQASRSASILLPRDAFWLTDCLRCIFISMVLDDPTAVCVLAITHWYEIKNLVGNDDFLCPISYDSIAQIILSPQRKIP